MIFWGTVRQNLHTQNFRLPEKRRRRKEKTLKKIAKLYFFLSILKRFIIKIILLKGKFYLLFTVFPFSNEFTH